jgi:hypothetical protein
MRDARRPALRVIVVTVLSLGLMGMGGFGGGRETGLPARDFHATFVDLDGRQVEVNRVTAGGDVSLEGDLGRGRLRVPFDNITSIRLEPLKERDRMRAEVTLREGEPVTLTVRSSTTFYGQTPGGAYQIRARDLRSVDFSR